MFTQLPAAALNLNCPFGAGGRVCRMRRAVICFKIYEITSTQQQHTVQTKLQLVFDFAVFFLHWRLERTLADAQTHTHTHGHGHG